MTQPFKLKQIVILGLVLWLAGTAQAAEVPPACEPVEQKAVKVEGYISKKFKK